MLCTLYFECNIAILAINRKNCDMTHVSKKEVDQKTKKFIEKQFVDIFVAQITKKEVSAMLHNLLTPTEKLMLAKRITIIALLFKNCSTYEISESLKVSSSTVARLDNMRRVGKFIHLEKILRRKDARKNLFSVVETILQAGMPPKAGKGRWSRTFREIDAWKAGG